MIIMIITKGKRYFFYIIPAIIYACIIFILSSIPRDREEVYFVYNIDKLLHAVEYYIFGYLFMRVFVTSPAETLSRYAVLFTIGIGILYGISDEWHQSFVRGRCASVMDLMFDSVGVVGAALTFKLLKNNSSMLQRVEERIEKI